MAFANFLLLIRLSLNLDFTFNNHVSEVLSPDQHEQTCRQKPLFL